MSDTKLKLKIGNIELEIEGDSATVERERAAFWQTIPDVIMVATGITTVNEPKETLYLKHPEETEICNGDAERSEENINTFLISKGVETEVDKCMAVLYYMTEREGVEAVDSKAIKAKMKVAKLALPKNISDCVRKLTLKGYIQEFEGSEKGKKTYYMTTNGKQYIEGYVKKAKKKASIKQKNTKQIQSRYIGITKEELNLEKYPDLNEQEGTRSKIMLMMYIYLKEKGIEYFTVNDIVQIMSNIFNERLTENMINGAFRSKKSKCFNKKITDDNKGVEFKLLQMGIKEVEANIIK